MTRIHDIVDLIQNANDIFLVNPSQNVRSAYIQIDDLCELSMKSWLQIESLNNQKTCENELIRLNVIQMTTRRDLDDFYNKIIPKNELITKIGIDSDQQKKSDLDSCLLENRPYFTWSAEDNGRFKNFYKIINEIKSTRMGTNSSLIDILDNIEARRENRNKFFHDHTQSGLTVREADCIESFLDLYQLNIILFDTDFLTIIQSKPVIKTQIAIMKIKKRCLDSGFVQDFYNAVLSSLGETLLMPRTTHHEFCTMFKDPDSFLSAIEDYFNEQKAECQAKVNRIQGLTRKRSGWQSRVNMLNRRINQIESILNQCFTI